MALPKNSTGSIDRSYGNRICAISLLRVISPHSIVIGGFYYYFSEQHALFVKFNKDFNFILNQFFPCFSGTASVIILLLASLNSCTNPWIYLAFSGKPCGKKRRGAEYRTSMDSESRTRTVMLDRSMSVRHPENEENGLLLESESKF